jgi:hypothetical protein
MENGEKKGSVLLRRLTPMQAGVTLALVMAIVLALYVRAYTSYRVPRAALKAACISNLKQNCQAALAYAADNDGVGPPAAWMDVLEPRMKSKDGTFHCPVAREAERSAYGYAYNVALVSKLLAETEAKESTPLIFDSMLVARNAVSSPKNLPNPPRHGETNCVGFADGHAKAVKAAVGAVR